MEISPEQLRRWLFEFKLNGFVRLEGLLPPDLVDAMRDQFGEYLALEMELAARGRDASARMPNRYAVRLDTFLDKVGGPLNDPRVRRNPLVEELVTAILGEWRHGKLIVECPCPGSGYMGWHTDVLHAEAPDLSSAKRTEQIKLHVPLVDVDERNGPMEVIPGSHRMHYVEGDEAVRAIPALYSTRILTSRGGAFLRDADLLHRGTPNASDAPRPLYSLIYKCAGG